MNIAISLQYNDAFAEIAALTVPVIQRYAMQHGYSLFVHKCEQVSPWIVWQRWDDVVALHRQFNAVVHLDADCLITNPEMRVESVIGDAKADIHCGTDCNGLNDGFSVWTCDFISPRSAIRYSDPHGKMFSSPQECMGSPVCKATINKLPQRSCNSYLYAEYGMIHPDGEWQPGDFILHLPGMSHARRIEILKKHLS